MPYKTPLLLVLVLFLGACSYPIKIPVTQTRYDLPEARGDGKFGLTVGERNQEYRLILTPDAATTAMDTANPIIEVNDENLAPALSVSGVYYQIDRDYSFLRPNIGLGISDRWEIGYKHNRQPSLYAKWQFLGEPQSRAEAGNFSMAVMLSGNWYQLDESVSGSYSVTMENVGADVSLITGIRITRNLLAYVNAFAGASSFHGDHYSLALGGTSSFKGNYRVAGGALGIGWQFGDHVNLGIEAVNSTLTSGNSQRNKNFFGWNMQFFW